MEQKEFILCAAIDYNGTIICGHRHNNCYETLETLVGELPTDDLPNRDKQGFLTSMNRYVGREEGWEIAKENKQIVFGYEASNWDVNDPLLVGLDIHEKPKPSLISENLY